MWWGRLGDPEGRAAIGASRLKELEAQLDAGTPTYVFLHRPGEVWRTRLVEIRSERPTDEVELIPEYYRDVVGEHHLWLKLRDFESLDPDYAEKHLVMDGSEDPESIAQRSRASRAFFTFASSQRAAEEDALARERGRLQGPAPIYRDRKDREGQDRRSERSGKTGDRPCRLRRLRPQTGGRSEGLLGSIYYGNLGPAKSTPLHLIQNRDRCGRETTSPSAIRRLLHGEGEMAERLADFLAADLPGIKQTVAVKFLSIWNHDRVLPVFKVKVANGKARAHDVASGQPAGAGG